MDTDRSYPKCRRGERGICPGTAAPAAASGSEPGLGFKKPLLTHSCDSQTWGVDAFLPSPLKTGTADPSSPFVSIVSQRCFASVP